VLKLCGFKSPSAELYGAAQFIRPPAEDLVSEIAGLGGTNLHEVGFQGISKYKSFKINKLYFAINT
jgi:hypothetical protein